MILDFNVLTIWSVC